MYNEIAKKASMKYKAEKRERIIIELPKGEKAQWKAQAEEKGFNSLTAYIKSLKEKDK